MLRSSIIFVFLSLLCFLDGVVAQNNRGNGRNGANNGNAGDQNANNGNQNANNNNNVNANGNNNNNNANANNGNAGGAGLNAQVIQQASNSNGNPKDGQSPSLTDSQNFVNFCAGKTLTDGKQLTGGSCNSIVMGEIPSKDNMIAAIILSPQVGKTIPPNTPFDVAVQVQNLAAGVFTNPDVTYYSAPQQLRGGKVVGHCHVVIQKMQSFTDTTPPSASTFAFFKGINDDGNGNGLLKATVAEGLPAGFYRVCTMMGTSNHQPPLMPVAQRGAQDDCTKFEVSANGGNAGNGNGNANQNANAGGQNGNAGNPNGNAGGQNGNAGNQNGNAGGAANGNGGRNRNGQNQATTTAVAAQASSTSNGNAAGTAAANAGQSSSADNAGNANNGNNGRNRNGQQTQTTTSASQASAIAGTSKQRGRPNENADNGQNTQSAVASAVTAAATSAATAGARGGRNGQQNNSPNNNGNANANANANMNGEANGAQINRGDTNPNAGTPTSAQANRGDTAMMAEETGRRGRDRNGRSARVRRYHVNSEVMVPRFHARAFIV